MKKKNTPERKTELKDYLAAPFVLPKSRTPCLQATPRKRKMQHVIDSKNQELKKYKRDLFDSQTTINFLQESLTINESMNETLIEEISQYEARLDRMDELNDELEYLQRNYQDVVEVKDRMFDIEKNLEKQSKELKICHSKLRKDQRAYSKLNEKLERRNKKIDTIKQKHHEEEMKKSEEIKTLQIAKADLKKSLDKERNERKQIKKKIAYLKGKDLEKLKLDVGAKDEEMSELRKKLKTLEEENNECGNLIDFMESPTVSTFANGRYTDAIRETYIKLLSMNVGRNNVGPVIKTVLKDLAGITIEERLPSAALTSILSVEARTACQSTSNIGFI